MMRNADCFLYPDGMSTELNFWRAEHYHILMGCIDGTDLAVKARGRTVMGYIEPDPTKTALQWHEDYGWANVMNDFQYKGFQVDCVFQHQKTFGLAEFEKLARDIAPHPVIPNFADFWNWTGGNPGTKQYSLDLGMFAPWHFVQVGYDVRYHTAQKWQTFRAACNLRLQAGKTLIMGMYDPERENELLAAYLMSIYRHENLIWHYKSGPDDTDSYKMWNQYWSLEV